MDGSTPLMAVAAAYMVVGQSLSTDMESASMWVLDTVKHLARVHDILKSKEKPKIRNQSW